MNPASLRFVSGRADHLASYVAAETNENVRKHETICIGVLVSQRMNDALVLRQRQEEGCPTYVHRSFLFVSFHSLCFSLSLSLSFVSYHFFHHAKWQGRKVGTTLLRKMFQKDYTRPPKLSSVNSSEHTSELLCYRIAIHDDIWV